MFSKTKAEAITLYKEFVYTGMTANSPLDEMAIYLCKILSGKKNVDIGKIFGISAPAVSNVLKEIEYLKDNNRNLRLEIRAIKEPVKD